MQGWQQNVAWLGEQFVIAWRVAVQAFMAIRSHAAAQPFIVRSGGKSGPSRAGQPREFQKLLHANRRPRVDGWSTQRDRVRRDRVQRDSVQRGSVRRAATLLTVISGWQLLAVPARADLHAVAPQVIPGVANEQLYQGTLQPTLVTASGATMPGTHSLTPGVSIPGFSGFEHEGVGRIETQGDTTLCSGGLLSTGRHLLTAAHCFEGATSSSSWSVDFELSTGIESYDFDLSDIHFHPNYAGIGAGFDVAIVDLGPSVSSDIPRYDVVASDSADVMDEAHLRIGYGGSGDGATGLTLPAGEKRWGLNRWEANGISGLVTNEATHLTYDFDSGEVAQDGFGFFFGTTGPAGVSGDASFNDPIGEGADEVIGSPADSGGPIFVQNGNGEMVIAGVASYVARLAIIGSGDTSDIDSNTTPNSSYGEFGGDARLAHPDVARFVQNATAIPEPSAFYSLGILLLAHVLLRPHALLRNVKWPRWFSSRSN